MVNDTGTAIEDGCEGLTGHPHQADEAELPQLAAAELADGYERFIDGHLLRLHMPGMPSR